MIPLSPLRKVSERLTRSRGLARWIFGVDFLPSDGRGYFDLTTPALVRAVAKHLTRDSRVLDMGTGAFATIGLALWRRSGCQVVSTDIHPDIVKRARENVAANEAPIRVVESRFFDGVDEGFDFVTFNPPYVPRALLAAPEDFQSDGGPEGTSVVESFLEAFEERGRAATAYLGVNALFVPRGRIVPLIQGRRLDLKQILRPLPIPVDVYVVRRRSSA